VLLIALALVALIVYRGLLRRGMRWFGAGAGAAALPTAGRMRDLPHDHRRGPSRFALGRVLLFGGFLLYVGVPIVAVVLYSFSGRWTGTILPGEMTLRYWTETFADPRVLRAFFTSITLGASTTLLALLVAVPAVYWARVRNPRIRPLLDISAAIPFALPFVVIGFALLQFSGIALPWLQGTYALLVLAYVAISFPFVYWAVDAAMAAADVRALSDAAATCGASNLQTIVRVVLPSIKSGLATAAMLTFALAIGEFALVKVLARSIVTLPLWSAGELQSTGGSFSNLAVVTTVVFMALFVFSAVVAYLNRAPRGEVLPVAGEGLGVAQT
jgi:putative spermidine/putrescine transport system permease protein